MSTVTYSMRIDSDLKSQAETIYAALGQTLSSAINAFLLQSVRDGGFPFDMKLSQSQKETVLACLESRDMVEHPEKYTFLDVEDALAELKK